MNIPGLRGLGPGIVMKRSVKDYIEDKMLTYAAALAYQVLFAIFPFIIFLVALLGFLNASSFFDWLLQQAQLVLPQQAMEYVREVIDELRTQEHGGLLSFSIVIALWIASSGVRATMDALNVAYDIDETRPAWKRYPLSIVYTIGLAVMIIAAASLMLLGPQAVSWLAQQVGFEQVFVTVWNWLRLPVAAILLMFAIAIVYYVGPNVDHPFRLVTPGSVLAVIVWIAASISFGSYVANFANYGATYGSLGAVVVLLFYFYLSSAVLLFGAEVNATIEQMAQDRGDPKKQRAYSSRGERLPVDAQGHRYKTANRNR